jgi:hypothetical protein
LYALAWHDKKVKTIVSTRGTTLPGSNSVRIRHRISVNDAGEEVTERYSIEIPRPQMLQTLFDGFSQIDIHDHMRQGSLCLEESWRTKNWVHRIFASILGVIVTDCFFAYRMAEVQSFRTNPR